VVIIIDKAVILNQLTKEFNGNIAVDHINFHIEEGDIFGLLGPNGAGKTTTIRLLSGILKPNDGDALIYNNSIVRNTRNVRRIVGVLPENRSLYEKLTARENLEFYGQIYELKKEQISNRVEELLEFFDLNKVADKLIGTFSMGMKQKVALARSLIHEPKLLLLDEPTSNLDPAMTKKLKEYIIKLSRNLKTTILISSHHLMEIENVCSDIAIINKGQLISFGKISELKKKLWGLNEYNLKLININSKIKSLFKEFNDIYDLRFEGNNVYYKCDKPDQINPYVVKKIVDTDGKITSLSQTEKSLEDLYLKLVGVDLSET
jgi:ABC-2 type transport system ATP-binding protein